VVGHMTVDFFGKVVILFQLISSFSVMFQLTILGMGHWYKLILCAYNL